MHISFELFSRINRYLAKELSLAELHSWTMAWLPILLSNRETAVGHASAVLVHALTEHEVGVITERSVRARLKAVCITNDPLIWTAQIDGEPTSTADSITSWEVVPAEQLAQAWRSAPPMESELAASHQTSR
jgi:hypothetical protein